MDEKIIHISSASIFKVILIGLLFVLLYILRDLVLVLLTSVVLASAVEPAARWFGKYKIPRVPAVLMVYLLIIVLFVGIFYLFIPPLFNEISNLSENIPRYIEAIDFFGLSSGAGEGVADISVRATEGAIANNLSETFSIENAFQSIREGIGQISGSAFQAVSIVFGGFFSLILVIVISFYLAVQENGIENFLRLVAPVKHERYVVDLWKRSQAKIGKWMQGQLLLGLIIGVLVYLGLTVLGVKYALTLALLAAFAELIPIFGPILSAVPAVILGFLDSPTLGLMVLGLYIIIQQFENHLIYPLVVRKVVGVPPLIVIIALIVGGTLAGFIGILISVPVTAAILEYATDVQKEKEKLLAAEEHQG